MILDIYQPERFDVNADMEYQFSFEHVGLQSIEVYELDADSNRTLVGPTDYTAAFGVDRLPLYAGGTITFSRPHTPGTERVAIERNTRITQLVDFPTGRNFPAVMVEYTLDKATMICQELVARKCDAVATTPMTQTITFHPYGYFPAAAINSALDKLIAILNEIDGTAEDCRDRPGDT